MSRRRSTLPCIAATCSRPASMSRFDAIIQMRLAALSLLIAASAISHDQAVPLNLEPGPVLEGHAGAVLSVAFSKDGKRAATGGADKHGRVWDVSNGDELQNVDAGWAVTGVAFSDDGKQLATGSWGSQIWEIESGNRLQHLESHTGFV